MKYVIIDELQKFDVDELLKSILWWTSKSSNIDELLKCVIDKLQKLHIDELLKFVLWWTSKPKISCK
jgi:hypothetical protein